MSNTPKKIVLDYGSTHGSMTYRAILQSHKRGLCLTWAIMNEPYLNIKADIAYAYSDGIKANKINLNAIWVQLHVYLVPKPFKKFYVPNNFFVISIRKKLSIYRIKCYCNIVPYSTEYLKHLLKSWQYKGSLCLQPLID